MADDLRAEHDALKAEYAALVAEYTMLERRPYDRADHLAYVTRLHRYIDPLHADRLRLHRDDAWRGRLSRGFTIVSLSPLVYDPVHEPRQESHG